MQNGRMLEYAWYIGVCESRAGIDGRARAERSTRVPRRVKRLSLPTVRARVNVRASNGRDQESSSRVERGQTCRAKYSEHVRE